MEHLKELRKERGLLQRDVAAYLGVDRTTYLKYENGTNEPDIEIIKKLSSFFGVSADYILGREASPKKESPAADESGDADLDHELVSLLCQLDSPQEEQRVKDFVRGILAAREAPASPDK